MSDGEEKILRTLRSQAWCRAKGELESMLCTYYSPELNSKHQFELTAKTVKEFIKFVEENGLQE